jgi:hypothetical protein
MVLELADQYFVAGLEEGGTPALRDKVDRLRSAADEHDFARVGGIQKPAHLLARFLKQLGRAGAQTVDPAMHVGIVGAVVIGDAIDDRARFLSAGTGI